MKNVHLAIQFLSAVRGEVSFDIYGPLDPPRYWRKCQRYIAALPPNVTVTFHGAIPWQEVYDTFAQYEFFLFPTGGESYGHVVQESMSVGVPVLCGSNSPWHHLATEGAGFHLSTEDRAGWINAIQFCIDCDLPTYRAMALNAHRCSQSFSMRQVTQDNIDLFRKASHLAIPQTAGGK